MFVIKAEIDYSENHAYDVTECFRFDSGSVACVEEMASCIDAFIVYNVSVER